MSCSERSDEQAAERRRVRKERVERERERESVLGSPESSDWKVA